MITQNFQLTQNSGFVYDLELQASDWLQNQYESEGEGEKVNEKEIYWDSKK